MEWGASFIPVVISAQFSTGNEKEKLVLHDKAFHSSACLQQHLKKQELFQQTTDTQYFTKGDKKEPLE